MTQKWQTPRILGVFITQNLKHQKTYCIFTDPIRKQQSVFISIVVNLCKKIKAIKPNNSAAIKTTSFFPSSVPFTMFKARRKGFQPRLQYACLTMRDKHFFYQQCIDEQYYSISPAKREWKQCILTNCIQPLNWPGTGIKTRSRHDSPSYGICSKPRFFFPPQRTL